MPVAASGWLSAAGTILKIMHDDTNRQTGRTTQQMNEAPQGAVFIWVNEMLGYPRALAEKIGRTDLEIIPPQRLSEEFVKLRSMGRRHCMDLVIDHATQLDRSGLEAVKCLEVIRNTTVHHHG